MKLKRLHLQGFKSFKDRTTIHFDEGITGIVGPNGCGKSNIVDALFWIMGEQSAKHLRGKKMSDLIFAGSDKYKPANWAEVTLVMENDGGKHIHIGSKVIKPSEIQMTRKLYRNGETEYRLNNEICRLKDIHEVFMDTGAGAKSYSIIAQGEINRLVQSKPIERRSMIEDVAGVTKFKIRKKESERKLLKTQENIARLDDLALEVHKQLKNLERQSEKASRARKLKEQIKRHELITKSHQEHEFLEQYSQAQMELNDIEKKSAEYKASLEELQASLDEKREKATQSKIQLDEKQEAFNEASTVLAKSEERLHSLTRLIEQKEDQLQSFQDDLSESLDLISSKKDKKEELQTTYQDFCEQSVSEDKVLQAQERFEESKLRFEDQSHNMDGLKLKVNELETELKETDYQNSKTKHLLEESSYQLDQLSEESDKLERSHSLHREELQKLTEESRALEEELEAANKEVSSLNGQIESQEIAQKSLEDRLRESEKQFIHLESSLESLRSIELEVGGALKGAKEYLDCNEDESTHLFSSLLETSSEYASIVETLCRDLLDHLYSENLDSFYTWSKEEGNNANFLELENMSLCSEETLERLNLLGLGEITPLNQVVKTKILKIEQLLSHYFVVDTIPMDAHEKLLTMSKIKGMITRDQKQVLIRNNGGISFKALNPKNQTLGPVEIQSRIRELGEKKEIVKSELDQLEMDVQKGREEITSLKDALRIALSLSQSLTGNQASKASSLEVKKNFFEDFELKLNTIQKRKSELSIQKLELSETEESQSQKVTKIKEELGDLQTQKEDFQESLNLLESQFQEDQNSFREIKLRFDSFEGQRRQYLDQISDLEIEISRLAEKEDNLKEKLENWQSQLENFRTEKEECLEQEQNSKAQVSELKLVLDEVKKLAAENDVLLRKTETSAKEIESKLTQDEKRAIKFQGIREKIIEDEELLVRDVFEKYQIDLRSTLSSFLKLEDFEKEGLKDISSMFTSETENEEGERIPSLISVNEYDFEKKFPAQVRESRDKWKRYRNELKSLGEINWQAIKDYDRQKLRYQFLVEQKQELQTSLDDLQRAIEHIDEKSKIRFKDAFEEVNDRFMKVFPIIFGGGNAQLKIVGSLDDPECGIDIIAQPPGKKMQNINLMSGGEKAMTAVSLIFSIFLVKPAPFCLLDEVDAPLDDANVGRFNELLREMSSESQFILITHNKKTMEMNDTLYGVTMQEPGVSSAISVQLQ